MHNGHRKQYQAIKAIAIATAIGNSGEGDG